MGIFTKRVPSTVPLTTGTNLRCVVCGHGEFIERTFAMNSFSWTNGTICYTCYQCRYIHWFNSKL
jgi:hypothetical protein